MKTQRNRVVSACLIIGSLCLGTGPLRAEVFHDDFSNPEPTNPDREPVTWLQISGDSFRIEDESLLVGSSVGDIGTAAVDPVDFTAQNLSIEAQMTVVNGNVAGLFLRGDQDTFGSYSATIATSDAPDNPSTVQLWRTTNGQLNLLEGSSVDFSTDGEVVMRLQASGEDLRVWAWPAGGEEPEQPILMTQDSAFSSGGVGVFANNYQGSTPSLAAFRYFEATIVPEPSTAVLGGAGLVGLITWRRRKRTAI